MLTVIIECHNQEPELAQTLSVLVSGAVEGLISDVVILDHGSQDGTARLSDAAGCRFYREWSLATVLSECRGEWLLALEPGARLSAGWIEDVAEYMSVNRQPARFSEARLYRLPFYRRLFGKSGPLESGLLIRKSQLQQNAEQKASLAALAKGVRLNCLRSEIIPARVSRSA